MRYKFIYIIKKCHLRGFTFISEFAYENEKTVIGLPKVIFSLLNIKMVVERV